MLTCTPADDWRDAVPAATWKPSRPPPPVTNSAAKGVWALAAVARLESDFGRGMDKRQLRTTGPLGLDPTEWATYAVDGDEDGHIRHADPADSAATLARLIWSRGSIRAGIFTHNQAEWYVQAVLADAEQIEGQLRDDQVAWRVALPGRSGTPINWSNLTLSNSLELRDLTTRRARPADRRPDRRDHPGTRTDFSALRSDHSEMTARLRLQPLLRAGDGHRRGRRRRLHRHLARRALRRTRQHALPAAAGPLHPTELIYCYDVDGPGPAFALPDHCDHVHAGFDG